MTLALAAPVLFALGLVHDLLAFRCLTAATGGKRLVAAGLSATLTGFAYGAWAVMVATGQAETGGGIAAYAAGTGLGTWLALAPRAPQRPTKATT